MAIFHFPQCEQELFYRYWDRLHAYLAQCASCGCLYEKWEILHVVDEGVNCETRALFEHWDFYARNVEEAWDFLDWLARDTYEFETSCSDSCTPPHCIPDYAPPVCEICHCSDHASNSCPYYISNESFARLSNMIETMNKQQVEFAEFVNAQREYDLSPETDLSSSAPRLDVNLCDDGASFPPLESGLEDVLDPPLTTSPLVAPSLPSTLKDNTMTYLDPPFPLAQSTEFEVGEIFCVDASIDGDDLCLESDDTFSEVHDLDEILEGGSCVDAVAAVSSSPDLTDHVSLNPLDISPASSCSLPSPSPQYCDLSPIDSLAMLKGNVVDCFESLGAFRGYDPSLDPYSLYLEDMPRKIIFPFAFNHSADFSKAFDKFRRALTITPIFMLGCSYLHSSELQAQVFDKLLRALTASELAMRVLNAAEEWLMLLALPQPRPSEV